MNKGLRKKTPSKDIRVGQLIDLPELKDIPKSLFLGKPFIKDQKDSAMCGACAGTYASELQEGVELSFEWQYAAVKKIEGNLDTWGSELRDVCKSLVKIGSLPKKKAPYSLNDAGEDFLKNIENWPKELYLEAFPYRKKTYVSVEGKYEPFDDIRAYMTYFYNRGEKRAVIFGLEWAWDLSRVYIDTIEEGFGHAMCAIGFDGNYLIVAQSAGEKAGDNGVHYIHRDVIDHYVKEYGAFALIDIDREVAEFHVATGSKMTDNIWVQFIKSIKATCKLILNVFLKN